MGQVNQIKDIRKESKAIMTGSVIAKPKAVTCSVHLYSLCLTGRHVMDFKELPS